MTEWGLILQKGPGRKRQNEYKAGRSRKTENRAPVAYITIGKPRTRRWGKMLRCGGLSRRWKTWYKSSTLRRSKESDSQSHLPGRALKEIQEKKREKASHEGVKMKALQHAPRGDRMWKRVKKKEGRDRIRESCFAKGLHQSRKKEEKRRPSRGAPHRPRQARAGRTDSPSRGKKSSAEVGDPDRLNNDQILGGRSPWGARGIRASARRRLKGNDCIPPFRDVEERSN